MMATNLNPTMKDDARTAAINASANYIAGQLDGGTIEIRTGAKPANTSDADSGTLLATIVLPDPAYQAASGGVDPKLNSVHAFFQAFFRRYIDRGLFEFAQIVGNRFDLIDDPPKQRRNMHHFRGSKSLSGSFSRHGNSVL